MFASRDRSAQLPQSNCYIEIAASETKVKRNGGSNDAKQFDVISSSGDIALSTKTTVRPYENTTIAVFLRKQIDTLSSVGLSQRDIALEAGYDKPNILSMFKRGETKVPLNKVSAIAKALRVDPAFLFRLAAQQPDMPITAAEIDKIFGNIVTRHEMTVVTAIREVTGNTDPEPREDQLTAIAKAFAPRAGVTMIQST